MRVSIVIPAKNEEKKIKKFVNSLLNTFRNSEIIVVCDGCTDDTYSVVKSINNKKLKVLNFIATIGKGGAIIEGLKLAKNPIVGFVDSDGSFSREDVRKVLIGLKGYDAAVASKWKGKGFSSIQYPYFSRKIGSRIWNLLVKLILSLKLEDTQAGLKFFKKSAYDAIGNDFICKGFDFDVELLYKLKKMGYNIREVYIKPTKSDKSRFKLSHTFSMFFNLVRLRLSG